MGGTIPIPIDIGLRLPPRLLEKQVLELSAQTCYATLSRQVLCAGFAQRMMPNSQIHKGDSINTRTLSLAGLRNAVARYAAGLGLWERAVLGRANTGSESPS